MLSFLQMYIIDDKVLIYFCYEKKKNMQNEEKYRGNIIFLDRDGILNIDNHFPSIWKSATPNPAAIGPFKLGLELGFQYIIVTNQSGIGRGYTDVIQYKNFMNDLYSWYKLHGISFIDDFFCPHFIHSKNQIYSLVCNCRKPKAGLIEQAVTKYNLEKNKSFLIGDKNTDINAAKNANLKAARLINTPIINHLAFAKELTGALMYFNQFS